MDKRVQTGRLGLACAIQYYTIKGYTVSIPLDDTQWYDLIIESHGVAQFIQCKATETEENVIDLRNTGGTKGTAYDHVFNHNISRMFCVNKDNEMFDIPVEDLQKFNSTMNCFTLSSRKPKNGQGFPSYLYLIK